MADPEQIAGISIGIGANISAAEAAISKLEGQLSGIGAHTITLTVDDKSVKKAVRDAKAQLAELAKTPVSTRIKFGVTKAVATQLRSELSAAVKGIGGIPVNLKGDPEQLIRSLGEVTIPVTLVATNRPEEGGGVPAARAPREPKGGGSATLPDRLQRGGPTGKEAREAALSTTKQAQEQASAAKPITPATTAQAGVLAETVSRSRPARTRAAQTAAAPATQVPYDESAQLAQQAGVVSSRGIYPAGGAMSKVRASEAEARGFLDPQQVLQTYIAAGGSLTMLKKGEPGPERGKEAQYFATFPRPEEAGPPLTHEQRHDPAFMASRRAAAREAQLTRAENLKLLEAGVGDTELERAMQRPVKASVGVRLKGLRGMVEQLRTNPQGLLQQFKEQGPGEFENLTEAGLARLLQGTAYDVGRDVYQQEFLGRAKNPNQARRSYRNLIRGGGSKRSARQIRSQRDVAALEARDIAIQLGQELDDLEEDLKSKESAQKAIDTKKAGGRPLPLRVRATSAGPPQEGEATRQAIRLAHRKAELDVGKQIKPAEGKAARVRAQEAGPLSEHRLDLRRRRLQLLEQEEVRTPAEQEELERISDVLGVEPPPSPRPGPARFTGGPYRPPETPKRPTPYKAPQEPQQKPAEPFIPVWRRRQGQAKDLTQRYFSGEPDPIAFNPQMAEDAAKYQAGLQRRRVAGRLARQSQLIGYEPARAKLEAEGIKLPPRPAIRSEPVTATAAEPGKVALADLIKGGAKLGDEAGKRIAAKVKEITPESDQARLASRGGGGGTPPPPAGAGGPPAEPSQPVDLIGLRRAARQQQQRVQQELAGVRAQLSEAQALTPVRALSVTVGQIVSTLTGRAALQKRQREAARTADFAEQAAREEFTQTDKLNRMKARRVELEQLGEDASTSEQAALKRLTPAIAHQEKVVKEATTAQESATAAAKKAAQQAFPKPSEIAKNIIGVGAGVALGTVAFSAVLQGFQIAVQAVSEGIGRVNDRLTGFEQKTGELTGTMADAARANGGNVEAAVASKIALSGLGDQTAKTIQPLIDNRTEIIAGTKALSDQLDLIHAAQNIQQGQLPGGFDRALVQTTGGFPIGQIGGERSIREIIGNEIAAAATQQPVVLNPKAGGVAAALQAPKLDTSKLDKTLEALNEDAAKAGSAMKFVSGDATKAGQTFDEIAKAVEAGALPAEMLNFAQTLKDAQVSLVGPDGQPVNIADILQQFQDIAEGSVQQSRQQLLKTQRLPFRANLQLRDIQGQFERQQLQPIQQFLAQQAQPLIPFAQTAAARTPGARNAPNFKQAQQDIAGAQSELKGFADEGQRAGLALVQDADAVNKTYGLTTDLTQQWIATTAAVGATGRKIAEIQLSDTWQQVNYQTHQYDEQLRIANRSLSDAQEFLTGIRQAGTDNLGILEKQSRELDIQNTKLGFQLQQLEFALRQRQINFQVASAAFVTPGASPEERAARVAEAKAEAAFAQKQLDLQKQQFGIAQQTFGVSQKIIDIQASRSVTDLIHQISLLTEGRQVNISVAIDQERLNALQKQMDKQLAQAQSVLQQAVDTRNQVYEQDAQIIAQIGGDIATAFSTLIQDLVGALGGVNSALSGYASQFGYNAQPSAGTPNFSGKNLGNTVVAAAGGFLGTIPQATQMVVGEAGKETVAIIRNPRELTDLPNSGSGSGSPVINITITGNTVHSEDDMDKLARKVATSVEQVLSRKASLLGFRRPA